MRLLNRSEPILLACSALVLAAASPPLTYPAKLKDVMEPRPGDGLVLGSVRIAKDGKLKKCSQMLQECVLVVIPLKGDSPITYNFHGDDDFTWALPPGEYLVLGYEANFAGSLTTTIRGRFAVPPDGASVYIGELLLMLKDSTTRIVLADAFEAASKRYQDQHPENLAPLRKELMVQEEEPGTWSRSRGICAEGWGITCTDNFRGVTPLRPEKFKNFDPVDSLSPDFAWQPSTKPGVTYDFALYEVVSYSAGRRGSIAGRLVDYAQALPVASWRPLTPLPAGRRYQWSVRLREGDTVSNWSTRSHFSFFVVGFSSGWGEWFKFSTPGQAVNVP